MERAGFSRSIYNRPNSAIPSRLPDHLEYLNYLKETGPQTITGTGLGVMSSEVEKIHQENLDRLSQLTEKEILEEREKILSLADPNVLSFLIQKGRNRNNTDIIKTRCPEIHKSSNEPTDSKVSDLPLNPDPKLLHMDILEVDKLEWTRDLPPVAKKTPSVELSKTNSIDAFSNEMTSDPLRPSDNEIEKSDNEHRGRQARFDLSGLVVPPEADVDTHLGLHHHGEEPERAGYTIGEMFHLSRSSVPVQRRLALSMLASSLFQTRLGRHIRYLAPVNSPSLITCLLSSEIRSFENSNDNKSGGCGGILFLLRWCLDEAVSTLTSVSAVGGNSNTTGGVSLTLVVECIRCLANLICDTEGELFLNYAHEWPIEFIRKACVFIAPSVKLMSVIPQQSTDDEHDDSELAANDPVEFLFVRSKLARRVAWLLAPGKGRVGVCLPPDAAGLWLPSLIIRGIRHSPSVAYEIFRTSELVSTLLTHYLPINECHLINKANSTIIRPSHLSSVNNIPLPSVMRLCRIWIQVSDSILLAFINDHHLVERCLSYLCYENLIPDESNTTTSNLVEFLHRSLPLCLAIQLQIESIRCLSACVLSSTPAYKAINLLQSKLSDIFHSAHNCWILYRSKFITEKPTSHLEEDYFLGQLLTSWIDFLVNLSYCLIESESNKSSDSTTLIRQTVQMVIESIFDWCCELDQHIIKNLKCNLITPIWENFESDLTEAGLNTPLMTVVITSSFRCLQLLSRISLQPKTSFHEQSINHWNNSLTPIFKLPFWNQMLYRFIRNESVLTGRPIHVRDVSPCLLPESFTNIQKNQQFKLDWTSTEQNMLLDDGVLQLVSLSPSCLPNYGTVLHFCYDANYSQLSGLTWPKGNPQSTNTTNIQGNNNQNECDQVSFNPKQMNTRYLPLMSTMISVLELTILQFKLHLTMRCISPITELLHPLIDWIKRIYQKSYFFQWKSLTVFQQNRPTTTFTDDVEPHLLICIESELITRILLLFSQILESDESSLSIYLKSSLYSSDSGGCIGGNIIHLAALRILPYLRKGQEELRTRLLLEVIFNNRQIELNNFNNALNVEYVLQRLREIRELYYNELVHTTIVNSQDNRLTDNNNNNSHLRLSPIVEDISEVDSSQSSNYQHIFQLNHIVSKPRSVCDRLISNEWAYIPFIHTYVLSKTKKINEEDESYRKLISDRSLYCLIWINYLQKIVNLCKPTDNYAFGFMNPIESIVRLTLGSISYPGAGGLGFEPTGQLLAEILHSIGPIKTSPTCDQVQETNSSLESVNLPINCPSYYDLYIDLVNHYNALSYNSPVLANLVLWPCQQLCHVKYRRALWGEHQQVLNSLRIVLSQLIVPLSNFLEPVESNSSMIRVYAAAILSGTVQIIRQPLLFLIAVHHLNHYLYNKENQNSEFTQQFVHLCKLLPQLTNIKQSTSVQTIGSKTDILNLLRYYKQPNKKWLQIKAIKLNTNLHVGVHDSLIDSMINDVNCLSINSVTTFNEAILLAGIECYDIDSLPKYRQLYWNELFNEK
ncbi:RNA polymerase II-associated protein 1 [Schistosoma japonicum]|nr:RNA polymerase II-associated protein 1 [Schistosoma japonicum]